MFASSLGLDINVEGQERHLAERLSKGHSLAVRDIKGSMGVQDLVVDPQVLRDMDLQRIPHPIHDA